MIATEGLGKSYDDGRTWALAGIDLSVARGELLVLLGESGSGKTTLLKTINRLVEPTTGRVLLDGQPAEAADAVSHRRGIGYVFQGIGLFPHLSVADNIGVVPRLLGWATADIEARTAELLQLVGLDPDEFASRSPHQLSGGQGQRVGLARALAARPPIVLMDEPFGALDPLTRDELQDEYLRLHRALELTTVLVTHDVTEALLMADRIAVLKDGRLVTVATPRELLTDPSDEYAGRLMAMPRRQAARIDALLEGS